MREKEKRTPITFILSDESVNVYGFRTLVDGIDVTQFERNPVMLYNHNDREMPIGTWLNLRKENRKLLADANFDYDDPDPEVQRVIGKVERGIIKMVSVGLCDVELSDDYKYRIEGQTLPTVIKSRLRESSIVTFGANHNAIKLYDRTGTLINLSDELKLADFFGFPKQGGKPVQATQRFDDTELLALMDKSFDELDRENKMAYLKQHHPQMYQQKYDEKFNPGSAAYKVKERKELADKSWDKIDREGLLYRLKEHYPDLYVIKYKEKFSTLPNLK